MSAFTVYLFREKYLSLSLILHPDNIGGRVDKELSKVCMQIPTRSFEISKEFSAAESGEIHYDYFISWYVLFSTFYDG